MFVYETEPKQNLGAGDGNRTHLSDCDYTAGCGIASAARRLNLSAFGDSKVGINPGVFPGGGQFSRISNKPAVVGLI